MNGNKINVFEVQCSIYVANYNLHRTVNRVFAKFNYVSYLSVADAGFPVGGRGPIGGA